MFEPVAVECKSHEIDFISLGCHSNPPVNFFANNLQALGIEVGNACLLKILKSICRCPQILQRRGSGILEFNYLLLQWSATKKGPRPFNESDCGECNT